MIASNVLYLKSTSTARQMQVSFLVERYHRAIDEEGTYVASLLERLMDVDLYFCPLFDAVTALNRSMRTHATWQERRAFPVYTCDAPCPRVLGQGWLTDATAGLQAAERVRLTCAASMRDSPLQQRLLHLVDEVEAHFREEMSLFVAWGGVDFALPPARDSGLGAAGAPALAL